MLYYLLFTCQQTLRNKIRMNLIDGFFDVENRPQQNVFGTLNFVKRKKAVG